MYTNVFFKQRKDEIFSKNSNGHLEINAELISGDCKLFGSPEVLQHNKKFTKTATILLYLNDIKCLQDEDVAMTSIENLGDKVVIHGVRHNINLLESPDLLDYIKNKYYLEKAKMIFQIHVLNWIYRGPSFEYKFDMWIKEARHPFSFYVKKELIKSNFVVDIKGVIAEIHIGNE